MTTPPNAAPPTKTPPRAWAVLLLNRLHYTSVVLSSFAFGLFLPFIRADLGLTYLQVGILQGLWWAASAAFLVPSSVLFGRFDPNRRALAALALITPLAFAQGLATGFTSLLAARFLTVLAYATMASARPLLLRQWAAPAQYATITAAGLSLHSAGMAAVLTFSPLLIVALGSWRLAYFAQGALLAAQLLAWALLTRQAPTTPPSPTATPDSANAANNPTVAGNATAANSAVANDNATVADSAVANNNATAANSTAVSDNATAANSAASDDTAIADNAIVNHNTAAADNTTVDDTAGASDDATAANSATANNNTTVFDNATTADSDTVNDSATVAHNAVSADSAAAIDDAAAANSAAAGDDAVAGSATANDTATPKPSAAPPDATDTTHTANADTPDAEPPPTRALLDYPHAWLLGVVMLCLSASWTTVLTFLPTLLETERGIVISEGSLLFGFLYYALIPGGLLGSRIFQHITNRRLMILIPATANTLFTLGALLSESATMAAAMLTGLGLVWIFVPAMEVLPFEFRNIRPRQVSALTALTLTFSAIGFGGGPALAGAIAQTTGSLSTGVLLVATLTTLGIAAATLFPKTPSRSV